MKKQKTAVQNFGRTSLKIVQTYFPQVTRVNDAEKPIIVEVTKPDVDWSNDKDHKTCALAVACKRMFHADGVIIGMTVSYIIKGNTATRYSNCATVSREITSFDRKAGFDTGFYHLSAPSPSMRFGVSRTKGTSGKPNPDKKRFKHYTRGVRTVVRA